MNNWQTALKAVSEILSNQQITWLVVGSVASALRGCRFEPNDLDLLVPDYGSLAKFTVLINQQPSAGEAVSIQTQEFPGGFKWHKLYWNKDGFQTDISFIESGGGIPDSENGDGVWEGGKLIWKYIEQVDFQGSAIAVPPLSVQLESQLRREQLDRAREIKRVMQTQGYNHDLARRCMSIKNYAFLER